MMPTQADSLPGSATLELTVVIPCLNEVATVGRCVGKAVRTMQECGIAGEVVVADNGSSDGSQAATEAAGGRVVAVPARGYGSALAGGIAAARGRYVLMGDADDSYDFTELARFLAPLRDGRRPGAGVPPALGRRHRPPRRDAVPASGLGQPDVLVVRPALVPGADP